MTKNIIRINISYHIYTKEPTFRSLELEASYILKFPTNSILAIVSFAAHHMQNNANNNFLCLIAFGKDKIFKCVIGGRHLTYEVWVIIWITISSNIPTHIVHTILPPRLQKSILNGTVINNIHQIFIQIVFITWSFYISY